MWGTGNQACLAGFSSQPANTHGGGDIRCHSHTLSALRGEYQRTTLISDLTANKHEEGRSKLAAPKESYDGRDPHNDVARRVKQQNTHLGISLSIAKLAEIARKCARLAATIHLGDCLRHAAQRGYPALSIWSPPPLVFFLSPLRCMPQTHLDVSCASCGEEGEGAEIVRDIQSRCLNVRASGSCSL
eukprot:5692423-Amphidinium_carterae.1